VSIRVLSYDDKYRLALRYQAGEDLHADALELRMKLSSLERRLREWAAGQVAQSPKERFDKPPTTADCLVLADPHCPYHDADFINLCVDLAQSAGIKEVIVAGDLVDYNALSPFDPNVHDILETEYATAEQFLEVLSKAFEKVTCIKGNHEARLDKRLGYHQIGADRLGRLFTSASNIHWSPYYHAISGTWRISHPKNASVMPGAVAAKLATKYRTNVIAGHGHLFGVAQDLTGQFIGIDSGACCDPDRLEYITARMNTRPVVYQGAVILRDNYPYLISKHFDTQALRRALRE
jgi:predicted phosphodiesterase